MHSGAYDPVAEARRVLEVPPVRRDELGRTCVDRLPLRLAQTVVELHDIVRDISTAVGGATSSHVSAAFLRLVPCEVRARVAALREEIDSAMAVAVAHAPELAGGTPRQAIEYLIKRREEAGQRLADVRHELAALRNLLRDHVLLQTDATKLREAIGLMTTIKPDMVMRADDPVGMAREVAAWVDMIRGDRDAAQERVRVAEGMLADVRCELDAAGVPPNPDISSRVRSLAQMRAFELPPPAIAGDEKPLFTALVPGSWSTSAGEWFTYRRIGTTPWVTVWWRHGPGISNSTYMPGNPGGGVVRDPNRSPYSRHAVANQVEQIARGLTYNETAEEGCAKHWLFEVASRIRSGATTDPEAKSRQVQRDDVAAILRALGLGDHARTASCHEIVQGEILPEIARLAAAGEKNARAADERGAALVGKQVVIDCASSALDALGVDAGDTIVARIQALGRMLEGCQVPPTARFVEQVQHLARMASGGGGRGDTDEIRKLRDASKAWDAHCDEFQRLADEHRGSIRVGETANQALRRTLRESKALAEFAQPKAPPTGEVVDRRTVNEILQALGVPLDYYGRDKAPLQDLLWQDVLSRVRSITEEVHRARAYVHYKSACLSGRVAALVDLLIDASHAEKELAEIRDLLDKGCWPDSVGGPNPRKLRVAERVAEVASRARTFAEAEAMATERAQRAEAQLREVARRVAGWAPVSAEGDKVPVNTCAGPA